MPAPIVGFAEELFTRSAAHTAFGCRAHDRQRVDVVDELQPVEETTVGPPPLHPPAAVAAQRVIGCIALASILVAHSLDVWPEEAFIDEPADDASDPLADAQIVTNGRHTRDKIRVAGHPAEPQSRREDLAEAVDLENNTGVVDVEQ